MIGWKKKLKFANSSIYDVVSDHNFRQTFTHFDEVYQNQNSGLSLNYTEFFLKNILVNTKYRYDLLMLPGCKAGRSQALVKAEGEVKHM